MIFMILLAWHAGFVAAQLASSNSRPVITLKDALPLRLSLAQFRRFSSDTGEATCFDEKYGDLTARMDVEFPLIDPANPIGEHTLRYICTNKDGQEKKRERTIIIVPASILSGGVVVALAFSIAAVLVCLTTSAKIWDIKQKQEIRGLGQAKRNRSFVEAPDDEQDVEMQAGGDDDENDRLIVM